jgi:hypothetical protein
MNPKIIIPVSNETALCDECLKSIDLMRLEGYKVVTPKNINPAVGMISEIDLNYKAHLFMDSDIAATVKHIKQLENSGYPVISGAYTKTVVNGELVGNTLHNNAFVAGIWGSSVGFIGGVVPCDQVGIIPVDWSGTGFLYVETWVLSDMVEKCDDPIFYYKTMTAPHLRFGKEQTSYDLGFAINCRKIGVQMYLNCDCKVIHLFRE